MFVRRTTSRTNSHKTVLVCTIAPVRMDPAPLESTMAIGMIQACSLLLHSERRPPGYYRANSYIKINAARDSICSLVHPSASRCTTTTMLITFVRPTLPLFLPDSPPIPMISPPVTQTRLTITPPCRTTPSAHRCPAETQSSQAVADDRRSYFAATSQGNALEQYATPHSPPNSYTTSTPSGRMNPQSPQHVPHHTQQQFIPTPSQTYQVYSSTSSTSSPRPRASVEPYYHMSPNPQHVLHSPSPTHGGRPAHGSYPVNPLTATGDRYPCDICERTFTRLHDRRRHYETVHASSPVLHKCCYCRKDFSRADSLKRHLDNGCDEMPADR
ncbi:hypothetical protein BS17DRAFT_440508 [Gyrodon lividus]|nr:hypothetical protein BS17DRAFT_440508 [Gyrodon lividus]